jgi:hypothetical protein
MVVGLASIRIIFFQIAKILKSKVTKWPLINTNLNSILPRGLLFVLYSSHEAY